jgi:hypothetical protein
MHEQYAGQAEGMLEKAIQRTLAQTTATIDRVQREVPRDTIVRANVLDFSHDDTHLFMAAGGQDWRLHNHALGQVAEQASVPKVYVDTLGAGEEWERDLLDQILTTTFQHSGDRHLVRAIDTGQGLEARGFLSDKFRRLDSRPLLDTFVKEVMQFGAKPYAGVMTDTRVSLKALLPKPFIFEVPEGAVRPDHHGGAGVEAIALGIEWRNSDYGTSRNNLAAFILRLWCLNGAVLEDVMRQVHLGGRLDENIEFSEQTYQLDTRASVSAMRDVVRGLLAPQKVQQTIERIKALSSKVIKWDQIKAQFAKGLTKEELRKVDEAYQGPDVQNLPPGDTAWRASNALSWIANQTENQERRLELEKIAGSVLKQAA